MNYLGHNEFGLNHKPWNKPANFYDLNKIDYWLEQWILFYKKIYDKYKSYANCHFVIYEELVNPDYIKILLKKINFHEIENLKINYFKNSNKQELNINFSNSIYEDANNIHINFKNRHI
jgi:hypothetical protein